MKSRRLLSGVLLFLVTSSARAQAAPTANEALAEAQFNEGRKLVEAGRPAEACPKFESSQRLDPALGTLLNLADCYERVGQFASAQQRFLEAAQTAIADGYPDAEQGARERANRLETRVAKIVFSVQQPEPGLSVTCDGRAVDAALWTRGVAVDPGSHTIAASAPGRQPFQTTLVIDAQPGARSVVVPPLATEPGPLAVGESAGNGSSHASSGLGPKRTVALVLGGVGVAGVVVGSVFGFKSMSKHNDADDHCDGKVCDAAGVELKSDAIHAGNISTVAFVLGGAGLAAGAALWLLGGSEGSGRSVGVRLTPAGALLSGRF